MPRHEKNGLGVSEGLLVAAFGRPVSPWNDPEPNRASEMATRSQTKITSPPSSLSAFRMADAFSQAGHVSANWLHSGVPGPVTALPSFEVRLH